MNLFNRENLLHFTKELLWWVITGMVTYAILYPITTKLYFLHWQINAVFIFVTFTYFRWAITFKGLPFMRPAWVRFLLFTVNLTLFIYLMNHERKFISLYDNFYTEDFGFPKVIMYDDIKNSLFKYLLAEITLFGTGSLIMIAAFQLRLIISYWQYYAHQTSRMLED